MFKRLIGRAAQSCVIGLLMLMALSAIPSHADDDLRIRVNRLAAAKLSQIAEKIEALAGGGRRARHGFHSRPRRQGDLPGGSSVLAEGCIDFVNSDPKVIENYLGR